jgi:hypothetical protein
MSYRALRSRRTVFRSKPAASSWRTINAHVLLTEVLFAVTRNSDDDTGLVAKAPMARGLAAQFGKAVIC